MQVEIPYSNIASLMQPAMTAMSTVATIPIRLVLNSICESEASGSARVTPVQQRRRQVPNKHPHRRGRKVSAPPELQPHLGPHNVHQPRKYAQGGAITDTTDSSSHQEYVININSGNSHISEGLYSGSDSGVTSEYSSWSVPVNGHQRQEQLTYEDDLTSPVGSVEDLINENSRRQKDKYFTSDSESESVGLSSPLSSRRRGMNNAAYVNTEPRSVVLSVDAPPPPLNRSLTDNNLIASSHNVMSSASTSPAHSGTLQRPRTNSMVVQLHLGNHNDGMPGSQASTLPNGRSVSLVSLNQAGISTSPNVSNYPNISGYSNDNQSIYSEIGGQYNTGYLATHHMNNVMGSQGSLAGFKDLGISQAPMPSGEEDGPEPTTEEFKKNWTIETLADNLSLIYAIFVVTLGIVIYLADTFSGHDSAIAETFNVFLIVVQLIWLGYAHIDVRHYLQTIMKAMDEAKERNKDKNDQVVLEPTGDGQYQLRINLPEPRKTIPQHYGFTSGRHGGSLYLKIGATVFCFGHLIHTGLNLGQKILYLTNDDPAFDNCTCTQDVLMSVLQPIYAFYNLFFVFKYSNLIINRRKILSRFGLMHCIAASLCFWVYAILQETLQAIYAKKLGGDYGNSSTSVGSTTTASLMKLFKDNDDDDSDELFDDDDDDDNIKKLTKSLYSGKAVSATWNINYGCEKTTDLTEMINYTTPYLYPFSIEYNILIVGVWILLWENIGKTDRHTHIPSVEVTYEEDNSKGFSSNMIIYVDCHSSNRGLFAGLLMTVATVISIILFFIFTSSQNNIELGLYVNGYSELLLLIVTAIAGILAYNSVRHLDVIRHHISAVDDILLIICLPCILLYAFFSMVPSVLNGEVLFVAVNILQVIQAILQTVFIGDGLRRCSNSSSLQQKKPGREVVTFLVVANVAIWLLETFEIKSDAGNANKYDFYGKNLWTLLSHLTLPLALFYRFHSSVCLADMWKASYEPEAEH